MATEIPQDPLETADYGQRAIRLDVDRIADLYRELLKLLGDDPDREGLRDTPARVAAWWAEFLGADATFSPTTFTEPGAAGQLVVVHGVEVWSLCEHHLLPFQVSYSIGYVARDVVLGLSKFVRIARRSAGRLQVQERLTRAIADEVSELTGSPDVAVYGLGEHLCMSMRGVRSGAARTASEAMRGRFASEPMLAERFLRSIPADGRR